MRTSRRNYNNAGVVVRPAEEDFDMWPEVWRMGSGGSSAERGRMMEALVRVEGVMRENGALIV